MEFLSQVNIYLMAGILTTLCPPALIYIIYSTTQIGIDTVKGNYNTAFLKFWVAIVFTFLLNHLCQLGLGIISWIIVFIPFMLMTFIVALLLLVFGLDPRTGTITKGGTGSGSTGNGHHNPIGPDGKHYHNLQHSHNNEDIDDQRPEVRRTTAITFDSKTKQFTINEGDDSSRFGVDSPDTAKSNEQKIAEKAEKEIQAQGKSTRNAGYKFFSDFPTMKQYTNSAIKRKEYVRIVRNMLIDIEEPDKAAQFYQQSGACVNNETDQLFESCLKTLINNFKNLLGNSKKELFQQKLIEKGILSN